MIKYIINILKNGYIEQDEDIKNAIKEVLKKMKGSNIINFSEYVDEIIDQKQLDKIINLLDNENFKKISDIYYRLSRYNEYMKFFMSELEKAKKEAFLNLMLSL